MNFVFLERISKRRFMIKKYRNPTENFKKVIEHHDELLRFQLKNSWKIQSWCKIFSLQNVWEVGKSLSISLFFEILTFDVILSLCVWSLQRWNFYSVKFAAGTQMANYTNLSFSRAAEIIKTNPEKIAESMYKSRFNNVRSFNSKWWRACRVRLNSWKYLR